MPGSRKATTLGAKLAGAAVQIPALGLRNRSLNSSGIKYYCGARQYSRRPTFCRNLKYECRENIVGTAPYSNRSADRTVLVVVCVAGSQLDATAFIEEQTMAAQKSVIGGSVLL